MMIANFPTLCTCVLMVIANSIVHITAAAVEYYSVTNYGARGDGKTDDTDAFLRAWDDACRRSNAYSIVLIPERQTFVLNKVRFQGPCKNDIIFQVSGNILRPNVIWQSSESIPIVWITFHAVNSLAIMGPGQIDGQGAEWWSCKQQQKCPLMAANGLCVQNSKKLLISKLRIVNSPMMNLVVGSSRHVRIDSVHITAPHNSPNTDGIHVGDSSDVLISNSVIGTGDDCVSIGTGSYNVNVSGVTCGPGHGISIGSLGGQNSYATAEMIHVTYCNISDTTHGIRIKTWQGGSGYAKSISFSNIHFNAVYQPILIDQHYCNGRPGCRTEASAVHVSGVKYSGITGTTRSPIAINLDCSSTRPCTDIQMENIDIRHVEGQIHTESRCLNAGGTKRGQVVPDVYCLK